MTLAVYGVITRVPIINAPPTPPPPVSNEKPPSPVPTLPAALEASAPSLPAQVEDKHQISTPVIEERTEPSQCDDVPMPPAQVPVLEVKKEVKEEAHVVPDGETGPKVKADGVKTEKVVREPKSRRSDEPLRTRDSTEFRERDVDSERTIKTEPSDRSSRNDHRSSRHDLDRSGKTNDSDRTRSDSDRHRPDGDRSRSDADRTKNDSSSRKRSEPERVKSERTDFDRGRGDSERSRGDADRTKSESDRVRSDPDRTKNDGERSRGDPDRTRSDSDRVKSDPDRSKRGEDSDRTTRNDDRSHDRGRSERDRDRDRRKERSKERSERDRDHRSRERSRDRHRDKERSERTKGRSKERNTSRESSRRPRSPAEDKKLNEVTVPVLVPPAIPKTEAMPIKKEEPPPLLPPPPPESFSPGVEMEAISDDDMPEVDSLLIARNVGDAEEETLDVDEAVSVEKKKADSLAGDEADAAPPDPAGSIAVSNQEVAGNAAEPEESEELEEIVSDEDEMFEEYNPDMNDLDGNELGDLEIGKPFNPFSVELHPLQSLMDPTSSLFRRACKNQDQQELDEAATRLRTSLDLAIRGEKWIDSVNHLATILPKALARLHSILPPEEVQSIEDRVVHWLLDGLDFELARQQTGPSTLTVRHIKCGLKLSASVAQCSESLVERSVDKGVLARIASLYDAPHMALSLKLMCLRSLDALLSWPYAMDRWKKEPVLDSPNGLAHLVHLVEGSQPSRAQVSLSALIKKMQTYEALDRIREIGQTVARLPPCSAFRRKDLRRQSGMSMESQDSNSEDGFGLSAATTPAPSPLEPHLTQLLRCLKELRQVYLNPLLTMGHLVRFLPVRRQFEISAPPAALADALQGIYNFMRHQRFLQVLLLLASHPLTSSNPAVMDVVLQFLEDFDRTQHGLCFLSSEPEVTILIVRALMHTAGGTSGHQVGAADSVEGRQDEYSNMEELNATQHHMSTTPHRLGVQLAHSLHVIQCLDALNHLMLSQPDGNSCKDNPASTEVIQSLHSLVFTTTGRLSLIHVLSLEDHLDVLVNILTPESDPEMEAKMKESAVRGYAAELVTLVVRSTENSAFYAKYGPALHGMVAAVAGQESDAGSSNKLSQLTRWVDILNQPQIFTLDGGLSTLCGVVKQHAEDAANFPPELIVALRLICPLVIPERSSQVGHSPMLVQKCFSFSTSSSVSFQAEPGGVNSEDYVELKYAYAVVQLFSHDMLSLLVGVLQKLCQSYEQPAVHGPVLAGPQGSLLLFVVHPSLKLIRRLLSQLIRCRDTEFHDLTAVPVLLQTHALVSAVPVSCLHHAKVAECCSEIISTLLAYTQPLLQTESSGNAVGKAPATPEDALSRSLWTQMVQEILKYIDSCPGPAAFITGLQVLNEMLPLPLPLARRGGGGPGAASHLSEEDIQEILNARKLWSVHLHTLGPQIQQVVRLLCCSGPLLLQLLRRVCVQMADLSASTALVVARAALDTVLSSCLAEQDPSPATTTTKLEENEKDAPAAALPATIVCSTNAARVLNFLAAIIPHPPVKAAILQLCLARQKSDEKYADFLQCLCLILNSVSTGPAHIQSQECVVSIFQSLLDADVCLLAAAGDKVDYETYLSAALPSKDALVQIVTGLWDHLANTDHNYSSLLPALRTLTLLTEHNYTFQYLQRMLDRKRHALSAFFSKMVSGFCKDSSDYLSTLSTALELLRILVRAQPAVLHIGRHARTLTVPVSSLVSAVQWVKSEGEESAEDGTNKRHPLLALQDLLRESSTEEESMESLRESLAALIEILQGDGLSSSSPSRKESMGEIAIPPPEPLNLQFSQRPLVSDSPAEEDRLSSSYWLNTSHHWMEESDPETHQIRCDLLEVAQSCLSGLDLVAETEKLCRSHSDPREVGGQGFILGTAESAVKGGSRAGTDGPSSSSGGESNRPGATNRVIVSTARDNANSKPYVAPMRGRGFGRPGGGVNSRNDPFRSRAPNTSRPPSLHVDDFVALEKNGTGSSSSLSGSSGAMKTTRGRGGSNGGSSSGGGGGSSSRGRGGGFASSNSERGGRFNFQPPRRDAPSRSARPSPSSSSGSANKWDDSYHSSAASSRFQSTNRVWTNTGNNNSSGGGGGSSSSSAGTSATNNASGGSSGNGSGNKERYPSPSSNASSTAGRPRHTRNFSR